MELIETTPGVFEQPRHRYLHHGAPAVGDTVMDSELLDGGTWTEWRPVTVVDDRQDSAHGH